MQRKFIEVTNGPQNWGKFMLGAFDPADWVYKSELPEAQGQPLVAGRGWTHEHVLLLDLQTGEGAIFRPGGSAKADLDKHSIWVCPMYEPLLEWLYAHWTKTLKESAFNWSTWTWIKTLPNVIDLPDAPFAMAGYRREGPAS